MTHFIVAMSGRTKFIVFAAWFGGCLLLAVAPPLYLWSSGQRVLILGMPLAIAYWLVDAVLLVAGVATLMHVEQARGEFGAEADNEDNH